MKLLSRMPFSLCHVALFPFHMWFFFPPCHEPRWGGPEFFFNNYLINYILHSQHWRWYLYLPPPPKVEGGYVFTPFLLVRFAKILKDPYFCPSLSVWLSVCLWTALLPVSIGQFWWNLVTSILLWLTIAATIMGQICPKGAEPTPFENFERP